MQKSLVWGLVVFFSVLVGVALLCAGIGVEDREKIREERYPDSGMPVIDISLSDVSLDDIKSGSKEEKYDVDVLSVYSEGHIDEYGGVEIKGRGNSTWSQVKKPY